MSSRCQQHLTRQTGDSDGRELEIPMAENIEHGPHDPDHINPKLASDIHYWSKEFGVPGDVLHEAIRVHGTTVAKIRAALGGK